MSNLRKLIDYLGHIEQGGELIRERDLTTGRMINEAPKWPTTKAEIEAFQRGDITRLKVDGLIGQATLARLLQLGYVPPPGFKPVANKVPGAAPTAPPAANNAQVPGAAPAPAGAPMPNDAGGSQFVPIGNVNTSFNYDPSKPNPLANPNGNGGHDGTGIDPNADPASSNTWPPGVKPAQDFGYLDPEGMWIPTPFHFRTEDGKWRTPKKSPANLIGIMVKNRTPFQQKLQQMLDKVVYLSSSAIEQTKPVQLPGGAPVVPGYRQIDASRFGTNMNEPGVNVSLNWLYAYQNGKNLILIAPRLFYNTKLSIGRHYQTWGTGELRSGNRGAGAVKTENGLMHVAGKDFNFNDMILDVVVHSTDPNVGPQILQGLKI